MVQPVFWVLIVLLILYIVGTFCMKNKELFSPFVTTFKGRCSSGICSTSFPKFPGVPNLSDLPQPPKFSTVQEDSIIVPTEDWKDPVQWRSPDNTVIIDGYGGIGTVGGDNYQYVRDNCDSNGGGNGSVVVEKLSGFDPY
jgi:hypothetical protein